jgi:hypothetical protein
MWSIGELLTIIPLRNRLNTDCEYVGLVIPLYHRLNVIGTGGTTVIVTRGLGLEYA